MSTGQINPSDVLEEGRAMIEEDLLERIAR